MHSLVTHAYVSCGGAVDGMVEPCHAPRPQSVWQGRPDTQLTFVW